MGDKTESVQFYVDEQTKQELRIVAAENEMSMAEYARVALHSQLEEECDG